MPLAAASWSGAFLEELLRRSPVVTSECKHRLALQLWFWAVLVAVLVLVTAAALCLGYYVQARNSFEVQVSTPGSAALSPAKRRITPLELDHEGIAPQPLALEPPAP